MKLFTLLVLLTLSASASAADVWGAIAFGSTTDAVVYGSIKNSSSRSMAVEEALTVCDRQADNCKVRATFKDKCIAMYIGNTTRVIISVEHSLKGANNAASTACSKYGDCTKVLNFCSGNPTRGFI